MNELTQVFAFGEQLIRVLGTAEKPLFVAADVCKALEIQNHRQAVEDFSDDEKGVSTVYTLGGPQQMLVVTEPGLYLLVFVSRKEKATEFKQWLAHEVVPSIRKTGQYGAKTQAQLLWEAFALAKTGKVQLEVLGMLRAIGACPDGIQAGRAPYPDGVALEAGVAEAEAARFWEAVEQMPAPKFLRGDALGLPVLYLEPDAALAAVRAVVPEFLTLLRPGLRQRLAQMPEWIEGQHKQRFGPNGSGGITCWAFATDATASPLLQRIGERVN